MANREPEIDRSWVFMRNWVNNELEQQHFFDAASGAGSYSPSPVPAISLVTISDLGVEGLFVGDVEEPAWGRCRPFARLHRLFVRIEDELTPSCCYDQVKRTVSLWSADEPREKMICP
jgi:hypothetical protein